MNLDAVRLYLALSVCAYHAAFLTGREMPMWALRPDLAVTAFFVISGAVIFASLDKGAALKGFYWRRFRRIYPGYAFVILASTALLATSVQDGVRYAVPNLLFLNFLEPSIPGAFGGAPVNGALWTLKIEVGFYVVAPLLALVVRRWGLGVLVAIMAASALLAQLPSPWGHQLPGQLRWFALGGLIYRFAGLPRARWQTDISFGLYIVHYPIVMALNAEPTAAMAVSLAAAFLLWHLIERPVLARNGSRMPACLRHSHSRPLNP